MATKQRRYAVIGAGSWGTATAGILAENGHQVTLVGRDEASMKKMGKLRRNPDYLPEYEFPESLELSLDAKGSVADVDCVLSVIPTRSVRGVWRRLGPCLKPGTPLLSLTKGIENKTFECPTAIMAHFAPDSPVAVLSGPSHAEEVARHMPTTVTVATKKKSLGQQLQEDLSNEYFRVYTNTDMFGVEFSGAMKNVIAIAAGIVDGLGFGDNTKAALLTRGIAETSQMGVALGARAKTFSGMAGIGDLITTAFSPFGRNRAVGERIGRGEKVADIVASMPMVAEGVGTTKSIYNQSREMGLEMPISTEVYKVLFRNKNPRKAVSELMNRRGRDE